MVYSIIIFVLICFLPNFAHGAIIELHSGKRVEGKVLKWFGGKIRFQTTEGIEVTFYDDEIINLILDEKVANALNAGNKNVPSVIPPYFIDKINSIPDIHQNRVLNKLVGQGQKSCAPTAISNVMMWLDQNGFGQLVENKFGPVDDQYNLIKTLESRDYINLENSRDLWKNIVLGTTKYIHDRGYSIKRFERRTTSNFNWANAYEDKQLSVLDWMREGILGKGSVLIQVGYYKLENINERIYHYKVSHLVTLAGYGKDKNEMIDKDAFIIHDPAINAQGDFFSNDYIYFEPMKDAVFVYADGTKMTSAGAYQVNGDFSLESFEIAVLESVFVLELEEKNVAKFEN